MPITNDKLMTTKALARMSGMCVSFFEKARCRKIGPAYLKIGHAIRYSEKDVCEWLESQRCPGQLEAEKGGRQ